MDYIIQDGELYHHGVKGQRWGVRRFQNADGSLTNAGKKRVSRKQKKALEKARKTKQEKAEAAKNAKQEQEDFETSKKKALESGNASDLLKFRGKLTNQELQTAITRINFERQLAEISAKETKTGMDRVNSLMNKVDQMNTNLNKGIGAYNTVAKILNSTTDHDLPIIDGTSKKDKALDKAKEKLLKSGTPEEISKHFGKLSVKELDDINKRLIYEDNIKKRILANQEAKQKIIDDNKADAAAKAQKVDAERAAKERYDNLQKEANDRFRSERESKSTTSYVAGLLTSGDNGSTTISELSTGVNQRLIDSGSNYIAGLLPAPKDDD